MQQACKVAVTACKATSCKNRVLTSGCGSDLQSPPAGALHAHPTWRGLDWSRTVPRLAGAPEGRAGGGAVARAGEALVASACRRWLPSDCSRMPQLSAQPADAHWHYCSTGGIRCIMHAPSTCACPSPLTCRMLSTSSVLPKGCTSPLSQLCRSAGRGVVVVPAHKKRLLAVRQHRMGTWI
jgi:hypothetical protein